MLNIFFVCDLLQLIRYWHDFAVCCAILITLLLLTAYWVWIWQSWEVISCL